MMRALGKRLFEPIHICSERLLFKLDNRNNFILKPNGQASWVVPLKETSTKESQDEIEPTLTPYIHLSIFFNCKGTEFYPHNIIWYLGTG